jgi:muramoyltetrapeptide carboxypeptidase
MKAQIHVAPSQSNRETQKPEALHHGARVAVVAPASPAPQDAVEAGLKELRRLGFRVENYAQGASEGYFSDSIGKRKSEFVSALTSNATDGLIALRGGYGSLYLLDQDLALAGATPKPFIGFSDITSLQTYLYQRHGWVTFYGPMVTAGFCAGANTAHGYDESSLLNAVRTTSGGWTLSLQGEEMVPGQAQGRLLGGCMTLLEATIGTPWELDTRGGILVLEDRAMKPYQVDRVLMHFKQAGKFDGVKGIVLGEFPESAPPVPGSPTVREVCARILGPLGIPIAFGAPVGHTPRPMLTLPLGVQARLAAQGEAALEILEPAVVRAAF